MDKEPRPSSDLMKFFGKKWTLLIFRDLKEHEKRRFNEIADDLEGISPKTLSERLKEFEKLGIVNKKKYGEVPPRTEYSLTAKGRELFTCFQCMDDWAEEYDVATSS